MEERQLFREFTTTQAAATPLITTETSSCSVFALPPGGVLSFPNGDIITLTAPAAFKPTCSPVTQPAIIANGGGTVVTIDETAVEGNTITDLPTRDPFYASTFPQCYALAATTVVAYTLVIMLFITPRSFLQGGVVVLGRRGFTDGGTGGTNIGGRPWLQKVAALTVAISLTIASASTFRVAEDQYSNGYQNAEYLQSEVLGGTELKVIRIISDTFLWLAQAQTLIRLFPRQREKVIIKWTAFALITLDLIFQCLNSFLYTNQGTIRPRSFTDAVPALSYLFQLSLGVLYAAWVIYYSLMKKRYAFYHVQMKNMCLVAVLSIMSIVVPVVFFVLDICKPEFTGWGDYVRWVGAAAASVIVWEWVERIEALEREEKKDGILGREVFDGDEMLDITPSDFTWPRRHKKGRRSDGEDGGAASRSRAQGSSSGAGGGNAWPAVSSIATKCRSQSSPRDACEARQPRANSTLPSNHERIRFLQPPLWTSRPAPAATPVSRTDTASAASTVYAVRFQPLTETTSRTTPPPHHGRPPLSRSNSSASTHRSDGNNSGPSVEQSANARPNGHSSGSRWRALAPGIPFPRVGRDGSINPDQDRIQYEKRIHHDDTGRWDIKARLEEFAVTQADKLREKLRPTVDTDSLPVMVIPAPPRRGAALAQLLEEQELETQQSPSQPGPYQPSPGMQRSTSIPSAMSPVVDEMSPSYVYRTNTGAFSNSRPRAGTHPASARVTRSPPPVVGLSPASTSDPSQPSNPGSGKAVT